MGWIDALAADPDAARAGAVMASAAAAGAALAGDGIVLAWLGVPLNVFAAGFAGSMFALAMLHPETPWKALTIVGTSTMAASYAEPLVAELMSLQRFPLPVAFLIGGMAHLVGLMLFSPEARERMWATIDFLLERLGVRK